MNPSRSAKVSGRQPATFIEKAASLAKPCPEPSASEIASLKGREVKVRQLMGSFHPVEAKIRAQVEQEHQKILKRIRELENISEMRSSGSSEYRLMSLEPLTWRNKEGHPVIGLFALGSKDFRLMSKATVSNYRKDPSGNGNWWRDQEFHDSVTPVVPAEIMACFNDVIAALRDKAVKSIPWDYDSFRTQSAERWLSAEFEGAIPVEVKEKISTAQSSGRFKDIFIMAETKMKAGEDPLVVGWDGANCWLIASFATTPLERLIADEFSVKA
ncbi:MAG TPA: hypothetical protein VFQ72_02425 [Candidatus Paceibacterota bacterium]|nr:hypothetical protein [Candidatus Paceibacterota bacterium]